MTKREHTGNRDSIYKQWFSENLDAKVSVTEWQGSGQKEFSAWSRKQLPDSGRPKEENNNGWLTVSDVDFVLHNYHFNTIMIVEVKSNLGDRIDIKTKYSGKDEDSLLDRSQTTILRHIHRSLDKNTEMFYLGFCTLRFEKRFFYDGKAYMWHHKDKLKAVGIHYKNDFKGIKTEGEMVEFFEKTLCNQYRRFFEPEKQPRLRKKEQLYVLEKPKCNDFESYFRPLSKQEINRYYEEWLKETKRIEQIAWQL